MNTECALEWWNNKKLSEKVSLQKKYCKPQSVTVIGITLSIEDIMIIYVFEKLSEIVEKLSERVKKLEEEIKLL